MSPIQDPEFYTEHTDTQELVDQHLDEALNDVLVPEFEDEIELWTTYGGD